MSQQSTTNSGSGSGSGSSIEIINMSQLSAKLKQQTPTILSDDLQLSDISLPNKNIIKKEATKDQDDLQLSELSTMPGLKSISQEDSIQDDAQNKQKSTKNNIVEQVEKEVVQEMQDQIQQALKKIDGEKDETELINSKILSNDTLIFKPRLLNNSTEASTEKKTEIKNGAIILFSSYDLIGQLIRCCQMCGGKRYDNVSHIGIYQKGYILEATGSVDQILKGIMPQVQYTKYKDVIDKYNGQIAFRNPIKAFTFDEKKYIGISYEKNILSLFMSVMDLNKKEDNSSFFCSELAAVILNSQYDLKLMPPNVTPKEFIPLNNPIIDTVYKTEITYIKKEP